MKLIVIGGSGLLGGYLGFYLRQRGHHMVSLSRSRPAGDATWVALSETTDLASELKTGTYGAVINAAAVTSLSICDQDPDLAKQVNGQWPGDWAQDCATHNVPFVHISTDAVFSGSADSPYSEDSATGPTNEYGRSKLEGEQRVLACNPDALVVRTNFFGWSKSGKQGILDFFFKNLSAGTQVAGFSDYVTTSIYASDFCDWLWSLFLSKQRGLFHVAAASPLTKLGFGLAVAEEFGFSTDLVLESSKDRIRTNRGSYLGLSSARAESVLKMRVPETTSGIRRAREERRLLRNHLSRTTRASERR